MLNYLFIFVDSVVYAFEIILLIYCISSWVIRDPFNKFSEVLRGITDPVLYPIRTLLSKIPFLDGFPIDFSVLIAFLLCSLVRTLV